MGEKTKKLLSNYLFDGILLIILGIIILVWPDGSRKILCIAIGIVLGIMGIIKCITYFVNKNGDHQVKDLLIGILQLGCGIALIAASDFFITVFQYITGIILVYGAIVMLVQAYRSRGEKKSKMILSIVFACITIILAIIIFINPASFGTFMTQLYGISLIVAGLAMVIVMRGAKQDKAK